jgi:hypothetical protein
VARISDKWDGIEDLIEERWREAYVETEGGMTRFGGWQ